MLGEHPPTQLRSSGRAAFDLARHISGVVIDSYGFPIDNPEDLLPPATS
jgi:hypothetical protein